MGMSDTDNTMQSELQVSLIINNILVALLARNSVWLIDFGFFLIEQLHDFDL